MRKALPLCDDTNQEHSYCSLQLLHSDTYWGWGRGREAEREKGCLLGREGVREERREVERERDTARE